jgi:hypothetical protein
MTVMGGADPAQVWELFVAARAGLQLAEAQVQLAVAEGTLPPPPFDDALAVGATSSEVRTWFRRQHTELERAVVTALVACFEAIVRPDVHERVRRKARSGINQKLKTLWVAQKKRVRFDDIVDAWKTEVSMGKDASAFKELMHYRHWLAHGRTWKLSVPATPPDVAWNIGKGFLDSIGLHVLS